MRSASRFFLPLVVSLLVAGWTAPEVVPAALTPDAPVADAAQRGDVEAVRALLRSGADVNAAQGDGMTALHWAAERGDAELARVLLYAGASVDAGTRIGRYTPLHLAARSTGAAVVEALLDAGGDPNAVTTNSGATPLHLAAGAGSPDVVATLLEAGAEVDAREASWGQTPLIFAAAAGRTDVVRILIAAGADPALTSRTVDTAEQEAADRAAETRLSELLEEFKRREGGGNDWRPTPSQVQAAIQASREIQRKWPDVPKPGDDESDASEASEAAEPAGADTAAAQNAADTANAEGAAGAQEEPAAAVEPAPVEPAAGNSEAEPQEEAPASAKQPGEEEGSAAEEDEEPRPLSYGQLVAGWGGLTPLLHAVRQGHTETALTLLDAGADIDQPSEGDNTSPLLMAAINGQFDLALELVDRGADPSQASQAGTTPLFAVLERTWAPRASYAHPTEHQQQRATHLDVMKALLEAGADPNARLTTHLWYMEYTFGVLRGSGINMQGATPFWRAAYALDVDAMRLLKAYGADPHIPTTKPPERRRRRPPPTEEVKLADSAVADSLEPDSVVADSAAAEEGRRRPEPEDEDQSGVPPVPVGGPAISPIHAASGVGYGQSFAGNAHRYVPDNWLAAVRFLVEECGAEVDVRDHNAYTALHHAASRGDNDLVLYLVGKGADVTVVSRRGQTTADMANGPIQRVTPYPATVALLERLGSKNNHNCVSC